MTSWRPLAPPPPPQPQPPLIAQPTSPSKPIFLNVFRVIHQSVSAHATTRLRQEKLDRNAASKLAQSTTSLGRTSSECATTLKCEMKRNGGYVPSRLKDVSLPSGRPLPRGPQDQPPTTASHARRGAPRTLRPSPRLHGPWIRPRALQPLPIRLLSPSAPLLLLVTADTFCLIRAPGCHCQSVVCPANTAPGSHSANNTALTTDPHDWDTHDPTCRRRRDEDDHDDEDDDDGPRRGKEGSSADRHRNGYRP